MNKLARRAGTSLAVAALCAPFPAAASLEIDTAYTTMTAPAVSMAEYTQAVAPSRCARHVNYIPYFVRAPDGKIIGVRFDIQDVASDC